MALTGLLHRPNPAAAGLFASFYPARLDPKFAPAGLDPGYLTTRPDTRGPDFYNTAVADPRVIATDEALKSTGSATELTTGDTAFLPSTSQSIHVPVLLAVGQDDTSFCNETLGLSCADSATVLARESPNFSTDARLEAYVLPDSGHDINLHPGAGRWFTAANDWIARHTQTGPSGVTRAGAMGPPPTGRTASGPAALDPLHGPAGISQPVSCRARCRRGCYRRRAGDRRDRCPRHTGPSPGRSAGRQVFGKSPLSPRQVAAAEKAGVVTGTGSRSARPPPRRRAKRRCPDDKPADRDAPVTSATCSTRPAVARRPAVAAALDAADVGPSGRRDCRRPATRAAVTRPGVDSAMILLPSPPFPNGLRQAVGPLVQLEPRRASGGVVPATDGEGGHGERG